MKSYEKVNREQYGKRIKKIRQNLGLTMEEMGLRVGVGRTRINSMERGAIPRDLHVLHEIAQLGGTTVEELLYGASEEKIDMILKRHFPDITLTQKEFDFLYAYLESRHFFGFDDIVIISKMRDYIKNRIL